MPGLPARNKSEVSSEPKKSSRRLVLDDRHKIKGWKGVELKRASLPMPIRRIRDRCGNHGSEEERGKRRSTVGHESPQAVIIIQLNSYLHQLLIVYFSDYGIWDWGMHVKPICSNLGVFSIPGLVSRRLMKSLTSWLKSTSILSLSGEFELTLTPIKYFTQIL